MQHTFVFIKFKTKFSGHNKIWGALPPNAPRGYGPGLTEKWNAASFTHPDSMNSNKISGAYAVDVSRSCAIGTKS